MYSINADYLEFRCQDTTGYMSSQLSNGSNRVYIISKNLKLSKMTDYKYYKPNFLKCFEILLDNRKVGFLYAEPIRNSYFSKNDIIIIRIDNHVLYDPDLSSIIKTCLNELQLTIMGISRLDIAYDTQIDVLKKFKTLYNNPNRYTYKNRGKTIVNGTGQYDTQINIGSLRSQGKTLIIYDKSSLLRQQNGKEYLNELYSTIFQDESVYRVEVRVTSKYLGKYQIDLFKLYDKNYLETLFHEFSHSVLDFRYKQSNSNTTRQKKVPFIELNGNGIRLERKVSVNKEKGNNSMKYLIGKLHSDLKKEEFHQFGREIKLVIGLYVEMTGLQDWYRKKEMLDR